MGAQPMLSLIGHGFLERSAPDIRQALLRLGVALLILLGGEAKAENPFSAAYRVNSGVITHYEIGQMTRLMENFGIAPEKAEGDAVDLLINDRLLRQEMARFDFELEPVLVERALERISVEGASGEELRARLNAAGIDNTTIDTYLSSQLLMRSYVEARGIDVEVSDEELSARIMDIPDQQDEVVTIAELVMPYDEYGGRIPARLAFLDVRKSLRQGESFEKLAREISRSPTAKEGGHIGPLPVEGLNPELEEILAGVDRYNLAKPMETDGAIIQIKLVGYETVTKRLPRTPVLSYVDIFVPSLPDRQGARERAERIAAQLTSCNQAREMLEGRSGGGGHDDVKPGSLDGGVALALSRIETGDSTIFERKDGNSVLYLCKRDIEVPEELDEAIKSHARNEAAEARMSGALQELRNAASIVKLQ